MASGVGFQANSDLPLNAELRHEWARGELSSVQVQRLALAAFHQETPGVDGMALAGNAGTKTGNIFRAMRSAFGYPRGAPDPTWIEISTQHGRRPHPFLLPHEFFGALHHSRRDLFERTISGASGSCRQFWDAISDTPFVKEHPKKLTPTQTETRRALVAKRQPTSSEPRP